MIVADTNLIAYLLISSQFTEAARRVRARDADWIAPPLWRAEFANVLTAAVRTGQMQTGQARPVWSAALELLAEREVEPNGWSVIETSIHYRISAYDAHLVALAIETGARVVTGDRRLVAACPDVTSGLGTFAE